MIDDDTIDIIIPIVGMVLLVLALICLVLYGVTQIQIGNCYKPCLDHDRNIILGQECYSPHYTSIFGEDQCDGYVKYFGGKG